MCIDLQSDGVRQSCIISHLFRKFPCSFKRPTPRDYVLLNQMQGNQSTLFFVYKPTNMRFDDVSWKEMGKSENWKQEEVKGVMNVGLGWWENQPGPAPYQWRSHTKTLAMHCDNLNTSFYSLELQSKWFINVITKWCKCVPGNCDPPPPPYPYA